MDTMTNVVGVLIIVLVMVGLSVANIVKTVLSDLPPVTPEELQKLKDQAQKKSPMPTEEEVTEKQKQAEADLKKVVEDLKTVDTSELQSKMKFMDLDAFMKQVEERKKERDAQKVATDKLLTEVERLKALLDETPEFKPPPPTFIRLPNPRPYPEKPNETRILVAKQGVLTFNQTKFLQPILEGMGKLKSQLEYQRVEYTPFTKLLEALLGSSANAQKAWPEIASLVNRVQIEQVALAYKALSAAGLPATKQFLAALADIARVTGQPIQNVAAAVVTASKGDVSAWVKLDPSRDPLKPVIKASSAGGKITFSWGTNTQEVKATPKDVVGYFQDLAQLKGIEDASKARTIYDATRLVALLERAAANPLIAGSYTFEPKINPGGVLVQLALKPKGGGGETIESMKQPNSGYIRLMRDIKADPHGVALFQVMPDAFETYHVARRLADEIGVPATWEFLPPTLDLTLNVPGYEVQRLTPTPPDDPKLRNRVRIAAPKKALD
jgi:hypothetical protein